MTKEEFNRIESYKLKVQFSNEEIADLLNFYRRYIGNPPSTCESCLGSGGLREIKNNFFAWWNSNREKLRAVELPKPILVSGQT